MRRLAALLAVASMAAVDAANFCDLIECTPTIKPVCGSNGVSYDNACRFAIARCNDAKLTILSEGKCGATASATSVPILADTTAPTTAPPTATTTAPPSTSPTTTTTPPTPAPSVTAVPIPAATCEMMCIDVYDPVCGSDGKTYTNKCELSLANCNNRVANASVKSITVASDGECAAAAENATTSAPPSTAPTTTPPALTAPATVVPATTAPTNRSDSSRDTDADADAGDGGLERLCEFLCPTSYQPVCGSDHKTYSNSCELRREACYSRATLTQISDGECTGSEGDQPTAAPVNVTVAPTPTPSSSAPAARCPRGCPKIMKPVCGSNGVTYDNKCEFENAKCTLKIATLSMVDGECARGETVAPSNTTAAPANATTPTPKPRQCSQMCTDQYDPVCGSDGKTYTNKCLLNVAKCRLGEASTLTVTSKGECTAAADADAPSTSCSRMCPQVIQPVCGSDGVTYNNQCEFEVARCTKRIAASVMTFTPGRCVQEEREDA